MKISNEPAFLFYKGWRQMTHLYKHHLGYDMTPQMVFVLQTLSTDKPIKMNDLSEEINLDSSAVSTLISRMEKKGLVERNHGTEDRRTVFVALTENGEAVRHINQKNINALDSDVYERLTADEIILLGRIVDKLIIQE